MCTVDLERQNQQVYNRLFIYKLYLNMNSFVYSSLLVQVMEKIHHYVLYELELEFMNMRQLT